MSRLEKLKRQAMNEANIRVLNEQQQIIDGYTCEESVEKIWSDSDRGYVICSKVDKYGYAIRVFKSLINRYKGKLPPDAEFQAGGETWEETLKAFENNSQAKLGKKLTPPNEPIRL